MDLDVDYCKVCFQDSYLCLYVEGIISIFREYNLLLYNTSGRNLMGNETDIISEQILKGNHIYK